MSNHLYNDETKTGPFRSCFVNCFTVYTAYALMLVNILVRITLILIAVALVGTNFNVTLPPLRSAPNVPSSPLLVIIPYSVK
jgi:hypothetical protein